MAQKTNPNLHAPASPDAPPRPTTGGHARTSLPFAEQIEEVIARQDANVAQGDSDRKSVAERMGVVLSEFASLRSDLRAESASRREAESRLEAQNTHLADGLLLVGRKFDGLVTKVISIQGDMTGVQRDVTEILGMLGKIAGELSYRATQDSIHDEKIAKEEEKTGQHDAVLARQETKLRRFAQLFTFKAFAQAFFAILLGTAGHLILKALGH